MERGNESCSTARAPSLGAVSPGLSVADQFPVRLGEATVTDPREPRNQKRLRCAAIVFNYRHYVAAYPPGHFRKRQPHDYLLIFDSFIFCERCPTCP
jgi:hypothetical protein